jgi:hypothetical protein
MEAVEELVNQDNADRRQEIDCTRSALADKLEALEDTVMGTVQSAQETVADSIQLAKDTVDTVKRTFDVKHQVEQHPWAMVGGCFVAGLALASLFHRIGPRTRQALPGNPLLPTEERDNARVATASPPQSHLPAPNHPGFFDRYQEEIDKVKGLAIGYVIGLVRDSIKGSLPELASQIDGVMNSVTTKLGGEPVQPHSK